MLDVNFRERIDTWFQLYFGNHCKTKIQCHIKITIESNVCVIVRNIRWIPVHSVRRRQKHFRRERERIGAVKNRKDFGSSFGRIGVVLSQRLAYLRTKKLCHLFRGLFRSKEATR